MTTITLDSQHELLLLDDGSIKIFRDYHDGSERRVIALGQPAVQRLLSHVAVAEVKYHGDDVIEAMLLEVNIRPARRRGHREQTAVLETDQPGSERPRQWDL